jgi:molybdate transport system ATP-binding protein
VTQSRFLEVSLEHVHLDRGERRVLTNIEWHIRPGERWVVLGGNGAGKTQLLKILAGEVWPSPEPRSRCLWRWQGEEFATPAGVRDEIAYLGPERQDRYERYDQDFTARAVVGTGLHRSDVPLEPLSLAERGEVRAVLASLGIARLASRRLLSLSYGERRLVLLARALSTRPGLLLLDEAGNGLDERNRLRLKTWLDRSRRSRLPWVYTTHRAEDVPASANRLLLLENGRVVHAGPLDKKLLAQRLAIGVDAERAKPAQRRKIIRKRSEPVLELEHADVFTESVRLLQDIDFTLRAGECWMVHGPNGSGKSTLLRTLYGDHAVATPGRVRRFGKLRAPLEEFRERVGLIAPHLHAQHLQDERAIDIVVSGLHSSIGLNDPATAAEIRRARAALDELQLLGLEDRSVRELSYGQMRRLLFARAFIKAPDVLLLDEPFAGVDTHTRIDLLAAIEAQCANGVALVMASHHREEWPSCASHELELRRGRCIYRGPVRR